MKKPAPGKTMIKKLCGPRAATKIPTLGDIAAAAHREGAEVGIELGPRLLYDENQELLHTFSYKINSGGNDDVKETGEVSITFKNGRFELAHFPFNGPYTRNGWRILAAIERRITAIEQQLKQP
jgi:hypothetical protein